MSQDLDAAYYGLTRAEILPLIEGPAERVLEVGCGTGATIALLRRKGLLSWAAGIESNSGAAAAAQKVCDVLWQEDLAHFTPPLEPASLDLILALDVLEHMVDPWDLVDRLVPLLKPGGAIIASIPNVRNYHVSVPLLMRGAFDYDPDGGLLDATHLRFFVRETALALMSRPGLRVDAVDVTGIKKGKLKWWLCALSRGALTDLYALQFLIRSKRTD